jgi:hypothetical protein
VDQNRAPRLTPGTLFFAVARGQRATRVTFRSKERALVVGVQWMRVMWRAGRLLARLDITPAIRQDRGLARGQQKNDFADG